MGNHIGLLVFGAAHMSYIKHIQFLDNTYNMYAAGDGVHVLRVEVFDVERRHPTLQQNPAWQATVADIYDPTNMLHAVINWHTVEGFTGSVNTFTVTGGANVSARRAFNSVPMYAKVYLAGSNATIANATATAITFNAESKDPYNLHDNSTNPTRITITEAGDYDIKAYVEFAANATGDRCANFRVNGTINIGKVCMRATSGGVTAMLPTAHYSFAVSDYFELVVEQTSGGSLDVPFNGTNLSPNISLMRADR